MTHLKDIAIGIFLGALFLILSHACGSRASGTPRAQMFHADDGAICYAIYNDADELRAGNCK